VRIPLRQRIAARLSEVPFLFLAIAVGIGLTFRVAIGWAKSEPMAGEPVRVVHVAPTANVASATGATGATEATGTSRPPDEAAPSMTATATAEPARALPKRRPARHGRR
jgi:hypothetical protein